MYEVVANHVCENNELFEGDEVRYEFPSAQDVLSVKAAVEKKFAKPGASVVLYHLDSDNLSKLTEDEVNEIFAIN